MIMAIIMATVLEENVGLLRLSLIGPPHIPPISLPQTQIEAAAHSPQFDEHGARVTDQAFAARHCFTLHPQTRLLLGFLALEPGVHAVHELVALLAPYPIMSSKDQKLAGVHLQSCLDELNDLLLKFDADQRYYALSETHAQLQEDYPIWVDLRAIEQLVQQSLSLPVASQRLETLAQALNLCVVAHSVPPIRRSLTGLERWHHHRLERTLCQLGAACAEILDAASQADIAQRQGLISRWVDLQPYWEEGYRSLARVYLQLGQRAAAYATLQQWETLLRREFGVQMDRFMDHTTGERRRLESILAAPSSDPVNTPDHSEPSEPGSAAHAAPWPTLPMPRADELAWLDARLREVKTGGSVLALIEGDAGVGKATLVEQFGALSTAQRIRFVSGRSYDSGLHTPYQSLAELIAALWRRLENDFGQRLGATLDLSDAVWAEVGRFIPVALDYQTIRAPAPPIQARTDCNRLHAGLGAFLSAVARLQPLVMALYDVHWADRSTLAFIHYLAHIANSLEHSALGPTLIILTYRPDEVDDAHPLRELLQGMQNRGRGIEPAGAGSFQRLTLAPLAQDAVAAWLDDLLPGVGRTALAHELWQASEGNPTYLWHILADWRIRGLAVPDAERGAWRLTFAVHDPSQWPALPQNPRSILQQRIARLDPDSQRLLLVLAVAVWPLHPELARRVLDWSPTTLRTTLTRLLPTGLLDASAVADTFCLHDAHPAQRLTLGHSLIRRIVYDDARVDQVRHLHRRLARQMNIWRYQGTPQELARVVMHARLAGAQDDDVLPALMALAGWALSLNALTSARELYWAALSHATQAGDTNSQMLIHRALGDIHHLADEYRASLEHYQAALGCTTHQPDRIDIRCRMAQVSMQHGEWPHAAAYLQASCDEWGAVSTDAPPVELLIRQGQVLMGLERRQGAHERLMQALQVLKESDPPEVRLELAFTLADLHHREGNNQQTLAVLQDALRSGGADLWLARVHERLGMIQLAADQLAEAQQNLDIALKIHRQLGAWKQQAELLTLLSDLLERRGNLGAALAASREALVIYRTLERVAILSH